MRGDVVKGLVLMALVAFFTFTPPGQVMYRNVIDWASDKAEDWASDRVEEAEERRRLRDLPIGNCGAKEPLEEGLISERQAVGVATEAWRMQKVPCASLSTELLSDPEQARWALHQVERSGCENNAVVDAETGEVLSVNAGCP